MAEGVFVTAITCMDGRVQRPVSDWMLKTFDADYVDTITEAGPDGLLAGNYLGPISAIRRRVEVSVKAHGSKVVAVVAHHDCAGNPVSRDHHLAHLQQAAATVRSWRLPVRIVTLWVNEKWQIELVDDNA